MNERIKELFQEAIDYADKTHTYTPEEGFNIQVWDKIRFEKFAELIVKACADYADMAQDAGCEYAGDYVAEAMGYGQEEGITEWRAK